VEDCTSSKYIVTMTTAAIENNQNPKNQPLPRLREFLAKDKLDRSRLICIVGL
jgi:hypothetical protein